MHDIRPVTPETFADLARLFEARGGPDWCWCMAWRDKPRAVTAAKGAEGKRLRKEAMAARVAGGTHVGLLAYDGDTPVGWVSTGPLASFARLGGPGGVDPETTWAISCFFMVRGYRGQGVMRELAAAAVETARNAGARHFQVTAVASDSPSYRFMGFVPLYESLGFEPVGMVGSRRQVMRLAL